MSSLTEPLFLPFLHQTVCKQLLTTSIPFSLTKLMTFEVNFTRELETAPWFDSEYKQLIIKRRKAQKQWIKSLLDSDKTIYYNLRQKCIELASSKESGLYTNLNLTSTITHKKVCFILLMSSLTEPLFLSFLHHMDGFSGGVWGGSNPPRVG